MINLQFLCLSALVFDTIIGDPRTKFHPVVLIGNLISFLEKLLLDKSDSKQDKRIKGLILLFLALSIVTTIVCFILFLVRFTNEWVYFFVSALLLSFTISPRALKESAQEIIELLSAGKLVKAREKVGWIVGRDTKNLNESEVTRATVETVAESITDGIISPLFYALIGGVPLAFFYRTANTLDSMVGYKNERYQDFGFFSAKFDDVMNFIPARITGLLVVLVAFILPHYNGKNALKMLWRDANKHPSPNGGYSEAPVAGALNVRLGGFNYYFGRKTFRTYMGEQKEKLSFFHIKKTIILMYTVTILFVLFSIFLEVLWKGFYKI